MSASKDEATKVYIDGLRNQHAVEHQAIQLLERQVGRLENYPAMAERMRRHIEESREQATRIEHLLKEAGTTESGLKDTMMATVGNLAALAHTPAPDEVVKNTFANFAFEHYEIAAYKSLLTLADLTGNSRATSALRQSLTEEEAMAEWINQHIDETTRQYVARSAAGEKAGR